jgi:sugar lactone lactonase YvrE
LFSRPSALASTPTGQIVVADADNHVIRLVDRDPARTVRTIAGTGRPGRADGVPGAQATFAKPNGVAVGLHGTIYVADTENQVIRRIENNPPRYFVSTYAGRMGQQGSVDNPNPLLAQFSWPVAIASDPQGNLYVAEIRGNRIRMIRARTGEVTTYAGNGSFDSRDADIGTNASFTAPSALAMAPNGDLYVLEAYSQHLRRISPAAGHRVDTIAGQLWAGVGHIDGRGSQARFRAQLGMAVTQRGEILLADTANYRIRKIVPGDSADSTRVTTIAGSGRAGTRLGSGEVSDISAPAGLAITPDARLIVSDSFNSVLRQMTLTGR